MAISVLFAGTSAFAVPSLKALAGDKRFVVSTVITQPDRPTGRKQELTPPPVKVAALELGLSVTQPDDVSAFIKTVERPDFLVVVSYGKILKQDVLDFPKIAPINVHASLLPRWRGASPLQHAILTGDVLSGVTVQRMVKELDAGPLLGQQEYHLDTRETFTSLHDRLSEDGAKLLLETLTKPLKEQEQDPVHITLCTKLSREDGVVSQETMTAIEIDRRVRALNPWPGVTMTVDADALKILSSDLSPNKDSVAVPCRDGTTLHLVTVQRPGGKPVSAKVWKQGQRE